MGEQTSASAAGRAGPPPYRTALTVLAVTGAALVLLPLPGAAAVGLTVAVVLLHRAPVAGGRERSPLLVSAGALSIAGAILDAASSFLGHVESLELSGYAATVLAITLVCTTVGRDARSSPALVRYENGWYWTALLWVGTLLVVALTSGSSQITFPTADTAGSTLFYVTGGVQLLSVLALELMAISTRRDVTEPGSTSQLD